jgi:hypothetical protein
VNLFSSLSLTARHNTLECFYLAHFMINVIFVSNSRADPIGTPLDASFYGQSHGFTEILDSDKHAHILSRANEKHCSLFVKKVRK